MLPASIAVVMSDLLSFLLECRRRLCDQAAIGGANAILNGNDLLLKRSEVLDPPSRAPGFSRTPGVKRPTSRLVPTVSLSRPLEALEKDHVAGEPCRFPGVEHAGLAKPPEHRSGRLHQDRRVLRGMTQQVVLGDEFEGRAGRRARA